MATRSEDAAATIVVQRRRKSYQRWQRHGPGLCLRKRIHVKSTIVKVRIKAPSEAPGNYELDLG